MTEYNKQEESVPIFTGTKLLNPYLTGELDNRRTHYPSSMRRKRTTDGRRKTGQISPQGIGGDNIGLIGTPLI